jgi:hypothetical protein
MGTNGAEGVARNRWLDYAFKFNFRLKFRWIIRHIQRAASSGTGASDAFGEEIILNELDDYENKISCQDCTYCNSQMAQIAAIQRHHLIQPRRRAALNAQIATDQSQSNQSSIIEMLVD